MLLINFCQNMLQFHMEDEATVPEIFLINSKSWILICDFWLDVVFSVMML